MPNRSRPGRNPRPPRGPRAAPEAQPARPAPRPAARPPRPPGEAPRASGGHEPLPPVRGDRLEGRNVVEEALRRGRRRVFRIWLDAGARVDEKLHGMLAMAAEQRVPVETV